MRLSLATLAVTAVLSSSAFANIKDSSNDFMVFNTDTSSNVYIGGGNSNIRALVSDEFADLVGGGKIHNHQINGIFNALVGGKGWNAEHGLKNVTLNFVTPESFSISYPGASSTTETVLFIGHEVAEVIADNARANINIKDNKSDFGHYNTDEMNSIWIGGGASDARKIVSQEFSDIVGGSRIYAERRGKQEVKDLFYNLVNDKTGGWNGYKGVENVSVLGLSTSGFVAEINGNGPSVERILFSGEHAQAAVSKSDEKFVNTKDPDSQFAILNDQHSVFMGGAVESVSPEFKTLVGKTLKADEAEKLLSALTKHKNGGVAGVKLLGITQDSFAIELDSSGPGKETILLKGATVESAIEKVVLSR
ncbi:hypothetical protein JCM19231_3634 [Vibrio ishigakensis]|uniref:Uncharacterized protein n=1 Tax=Vibrio ishigakensis TaxID=1481914 RepID=A0A0B8NTP4_9VIBR|nr:hypothetical protein [Vibrio ishigakensis]GAM54114.1 hypothetical protein JCM19231_3634 [Vibrio ishigakensis]